MEKQTFLSVENLIKEYEGVRVVDDISFQIHEGESVGLVGESGCGKSTTARIIAGLEKPTKGQILFRGQPYRLKKEKNWKCHINMVFQDPADSFDSHMVVFDSLYEALKHTRKISRKNAVSVIRESLKKVELPEEYANRSVSRISGGECQRIGIARAVLTEPELLICDEATSALDVSVQTQIIHLLKRLKKEKNFTYLFISHDLALVACMCTKVLVMYKGVLVEEGDTQQVLSCPGHPYTELLVACGRAFTIDESGYAGQMPKVRDEDNGKIKGCVFYPCCPYGFEKCRNKRPVLKEYGDGHRAACHLSLSYDVK